MYNYEVNASTVEVKLLTCLAIVSQFGLYGQKYIADITYCTSCAIQHCRCNFVLHNVLILNEHIDIPLKVLVAPVRQKKEGKTQCASKRVPISMGTQKVTGDSSKFGALLPSTKQKQRRVRRRKKIRVNIFSWQARILSVTKLSSVSWRQKKKVKQMHQWKKNEIKTSKRQQIIDLSDF